MEKALTRCPWAEKSPADIHYHDTEWGRPVYDEHRLFEKINLEAMQAGLSWTTILNKRENFRNAFDNFDPELIALYDDEKLEALMADAGIIRNRLKINAVVSNAKAYLKMKENGESLSDFFWSYVNHKPVINKWEQSEDAPAFTETSVAISKELKKRGFKFVGPTTVYALMQSAGMVNDHIKDCFVWKELI